MDFRILGSLEIRADGALLPLRGRQQPKILAVLLLEANHVVALSRLVDVLWSAEPPATARQQVQNTVSALRRRLTAAGDPGVLESVGDGYRITVGADGLDALRFDAGVTEARALAADGRHREALERLREALALWRGPALAGLSGGHIDTGARRLDESRLSAVEERVDLELVLREHAGLIGELRELVGEHPFRQRLVGQLMLALYRCGRVTEALEAYTECRTRLADELGIDPTADLRRLHERILRADPGLDPVAQAPAPATVPAQLPAATGTFCGRTGQLDALEGVLSTGSLALITGAAGAGKTALAVHWGRENRGHFPDGQLFVDLRGYDPGEPLSAIEALSRFLRALGVPDGTVPSDVDEAAALYRSVLAGRRVLVVLDNARDVGQVRPLLPGEEGCLTLVTSRDELRGLVAFDDARVVPVGALSVDESVSLLSALLGGARVAGDPSSTRRLAKLCGCLPLALRIVAANLAARPHLGLRDFAASLEERNSLDLFTVDGDPRATVAAAFDLSYTALGAAERGLFRLLGLVPGQDFPAGLAAALAEPGSPDTEQSLTRLVGTHLLEESRPGRYRFHDLIRLYARQRAESEDDASTRDTTVERMLSWYAELPAEHDDEEYTGKIAAVMNLPPHPLSWRLMSRMSRYSNIGLHVDEIMRGAAIALDAAVVSGDLTGQARMYGVLAGAHWVNGDGPRAIEAIIRMLEIARATGDRRLEGIGRGNFGLFLRGQGELHRGATHLEASLEIARELGDVGHQVNRLSNLARVYRTLGRFEETRKALGDLGEIAERTGDPLHLALALDTAGRLHLDLGEHTAAVAAADRLLDVADRLNSVRDRAIALDIRGAALARLGRPAEGRGDLLAALELLQRHRMSGLADDVRLSLVPVLCLLGEHAAAMGHARTCLEQSALRGAGRAEAMALAGMGSAHLGLGEYGEARRCADLAAERLGAIGDRLGAGRALRLRGDAEAAAGDVAAGMRSWGEALGLFAELGVPEAVEVGEALAGARR